MAVSNDTALSLGDTASFYCLGYGIPSVQITWSMNGQPVVNSPLVTISEGNLGSLRQSFLEICSASTADAGIYTCTVSNNEVDVEASADLTVSGKSTMGALDTTDISDCCRDGNGVPGGNFRS